MPDPSVHARIRSIVSAAQRGETEGLRDQVVAIHTELEGSDLPVVDRLARTQELARVLIDLEDPGTAAGWFRVILDYWQGNAPVQGRVRVVVASGDLARALASAGDHEAAQAMADEAREGLRDLERSAPERVLRFAAGLSKAYSALGALDRSRELLLTGLRYVPEDAASDGDELLADLAELERQAGRLAAAAVRLTQAERLVERSRPADHPVRARVLSIRARLSADLGQRAEAIDRMEAAVTLRSNGRAATREQIEDLATLAAWYRAQGNPGAAQRHLDALGAVTATRSGRQSVELAEAIDALAVSAAEAGDHAAARAAFETGRDLAGFRGDEMTRIDAALKAMWVAHAAAPGPETRRAFLVAASERSTPVTEPAALVVALTRAHLAEGDPAAAFATMTAALGALGDLPSPPGYVDALLTAAVELAGTGVDVAAEAHEWLLRLAEPDATPRMARQRIVARRNPALMGLREAVEDAYALRGRSEVALRHGTGAIEGASTALEGARVIEGELDRAAGPAGRPDVSPRDLAKRLGIGAWLLDLRRYRHLLATTERDVAFAVAGNSAAVYLRSLGEASEIDQTIATFARLDGDASTEAGMRLAGRLLGPLRSLAGLRPGDRLFVVPTASWASVPFAALPSPTGEGGPWVVHHEVVTLLDATDLVTPTPVGSASPTGPRVVGAPELGSPTANGAALPISFDERPGLQAAADRAAAQLGVPAWTGIQASTAAIAHAPSPRVMVVATHAYALSKAATDPSGGLEGVVAAGALESLGPVPDLGGPSTAALGWLSMEALARSDLSGTEVVDLSACALPKGQEVAVATTLARAFRTAGARAVVVALGPVSDTGIVAFGQAFHTALAAGDPPAKAVRAAQIELSTRLEPRAWGAFRCIGDGTIVEVGGGDSGPLPGPSDLAAAEVVVGTMQVAVGDLEKAMGAYDRATAHDPRLAEAHYQRGRCLEARARYPDALRAYREAVQIEPADSAPRYAVARLLMKGGQNASALEELTHLARQFPGDWAVWRDLVQLHRQAKDLDEARRCAERWLAVARDDDMAWHHYASILEAIDEPQKALVARERTVELAPDHALHWSNLGVHHARRGRFEQAEWSLRRATELDPEHSPSWRNLAQVRLELDKPVEAEAAARNAVDRDGEHAAAHFLLGAALNAQRRPAEARASLRRAAELGHPGATTMLGALDAASSDG